MMSLADIDDALGKYGLTTVSWRHDIARGENLIFSAVSTESDGNSTQSWTPV